MADLINFNLPNLDNVQSNDERTLKIVKSYLFQLTEQMKFHLNNIDSDNFTDDYKKKLAATIENTATNATKTNAVLNALNSAKKKFDDDITTVSNSIINNKGGSVVLLDKNKDGFPDELLILIDSTDYTTAQRLWRWNGGGFGFSKTGYNGKFEAAMVYDEQADDTRIVAEKISGGTITGVTLESAVLNTVTGNIGGWIIGKWQSPDGTQHEGMRRTFEYQNDQGKTYYETFAMDSNEAPNGNDYIFQVYLSDKDGNALGTEYNFTLSTKSVMEVDTISVRDLTVTDGGNLTFEGDYGYTPATFWINAYNEPNFRNNDAVSPLEIRRYGDIVQVVGNICAVSDIPIFGDWNFYPPVAEVPSPGKNKDLYQLCSSIGGNTCTIKLYVGEDNLARLCVGRYMNENGQLLEHIPAGAWIPINIIYLAEHQAV